MYIKGKWRWNQEYVWFYFDEIYKPVDKFFLIFLITSTKDSLLSVVSRDRICISLTVGKCTQLFRETWLLNNFSSLWNDFIALYALSIRLSFSLQDSVQIIQMFCHINKKKSDWIISRDYWTFHVRDLFLARTAGSLTDHKTLPAYDHNSATSHLHGKLHYQNQCAFLVALFQNSSGSRPWFGLNLVFVTVCIIPWQLASLAQGTSWCMMQCNLCTLTAIASTFVLPDLPFVYQL